MRRLLRAFLAEPLVHFAALGAALFALFHWRSGGAVEGDPSIVVARATIDNLAAAFERTWRRPPSESELDGLVQDWVREEACVREATALGLDRDDPVIRRRLRQKFEFVADDLAASAEPTDADLQAWIDAHPERFRLGRVLSFEQVGLDPSRRGDRLEADALALLAELRKAGTGAAPADEGDLRLIERDVDQAPFDDVAARFGADFAAFLAEAPLREWAGPVASGFGVHLVRVKERSAGRPATLAEAREPALREWRDAQRVAAKQRFYDELRRRHPATIEPPAAGG